MSTNTGAVRTNRHEPPAALIDVLKGAKRVVVFTGAGVSAESGIATFRSGENGLWSNFNPQELATPQAFRAHPARVWGWYEWRRAAILQAQPNPAHHAIATLSRYVPELHVITQNVDDLHERARSADVIHLHGRLGAARCLSCAHPYVHPPGLPELPDTEGDIVPPRCERCGGYVRPGVVWFGESLPEAEWDRATRLVGKCDVLFSIGTSALVYPAAELPRLAKANKATIVQVNPTPTDLDRECDFNLRGPAGEILPAMLNGLEHA